MYEQNWNMFIGWEDIQFDILFDHRTLSSTKYPWCSISRASRILCQTLSSIINRACIAKKLLQLCYLMYFIILRMNIANNNKCFKLKLRLFWSSTGGHMDFGLYTRSPPCSPGGSAIDETITAILVYHNLKLL